MRVPLVVRKILRHHLAGDNVWRERRLDECGLPGFNPAGPPGSPPSDVITAMRAMTSEGFYPNLYQVGDNRQRISAYVASPPTTRLPAPSRLGACWAGGPETKTPEALTLFLQSAKNTMPS
jgi:hypothetical protein